MAFIWLGLWAAAAGSAPVGAPEQWRPPQREHTRSALEQLVGGCDGDESQQCPAGATGRKCTIERLPWGTLSFADFAAKHVRAGEPVIFTGATEAFVTEPDRWSTRQGFVEAFGDVRAKVGTGAELAQFGGKAEKSLKLRDVVAQMGAEENEANELFVFDMDVAKQLGGFAEPELFRDSFMSASAGAGAATWNMLSLGGDGTGLGFHTHVDSWLGLMAGAKRWLLYEPGRFPVGEPLFPNRMLGVDSAVRMAANHSQPQPMDCLQQAGEMLYLPAGWAHATVNLGDTVGIGGQTQTCPSRKADGGAACQALLERLEEARGERVDSELLRLIGHAHQIAGHKQKHQAFTELAFRASPTMMGNAATVLKAFVEGSDVLLGSEPKGRKGRRRGKAKSEQEDGDALTRKQRKLLRAQRDAEADGGGPWAHPALALVEGTILPTLEATTTQGAAPRTLAKACKCRRSLSFRSLLDDAAARRLGHGHGALQARGPGPTRADGRGDGAHPAAAARGR